MTTSSREAAFGARSTPARDVLKTAAWFGLVTGFGEVFLLGVQKFVLHRFLFLGRDLVWLAPTTDLALFLTAGLLLLLIGRIWVGVTRPQVVVGGFAALMFLSFLLMYPALHWLAAFCIAVGVGVQVSRVAARRTSRFQALLGFTHRWMPALTAMVLLLAAVVTGVRAFQERRALGSLGAPPSGPNVLLVILDTVRAASLSLYGYQRSTSPWMERFATSGVRFDRALSTAPWTLPSHGSLFTGRWAAQLSGDWLVPLDGTYPTLAEVLSRRGYVTGGFVGNTLYCSYETGLDRGFVHYEDYRLTPGEAFKTTSLGRFLSTRQILRRLFDTRERLGRKSADEVNAAFLNWSAQQQGRPFFAFLNYFDAHSPYVPPDSLERQFRTQPLEPSGLWQRLFPDTVRTWPDPILARDMQDRYDASIAYLDAALGRLLAELERRGVLQNTLVIIASDHGELFGEHGLRSHGNSLYRPLVQVPLIVSFPGHVPSGVVVRTPVSLRDIPATVLDVAQPDQPGPFPGRSLARLWREPQVSSLESDTLLVAVNRVPRLPTGTPVSRGNMRGMLLDGLYYIHNGDGVEEMYDFDRDPGEQHDLATTPEGKERLGPLRAALAGQLKAP